MRGRVILLVVLILVVAGIAAAALLLGGGDPEPDVAGTQTATALGTGIPGEVVPTETGGQPSGSTPAPDVVTDVAPVVIALQDLPRGFRLSEEFVSGASPAVGIAFWPVENVPQNSFQAVEDVINLLARTDIPRESPILSTQLAADPLALGRVGSDAALLLDPGTVAIAVPLDISGVGSVAYAMQPGDSVDLILSFLFIEVDETFQTRQPNQISVITRSETGELIFSGQLRGRPEPSPLSALGVLVSPTEEQRPRLVTQRTIEQAKVIFVGFFPEDGRILGVRTATPTPFDTPTPGGEDAQQQQQAAPATPAPTATPFLPVIVTLGVDPQDALVIAWAIDAQIPMTFTIRAANDTGTTPTTAVTLQYLIENYSIPQPPILPFALEPAITSLRGNQLVILRTFNQAVNSAVPQ